MTTELKHECCCGHRHNTWSLRFDSKCNGLFQTWLDYILFKIHARVITEKSRFCRITPVLSDLHWLPVCHRINFKIATITFKLLQFQQPSYLVALIPRYVPTQSLRSSSYLPICVPTREAAMAKSKSFSPVNSYICNKLPCPCTLPVFRKRLKHHQFSRQFLIIH